MKEISINTDFIKLDQFLKWAGITGSGSEAKEIIASGEVKVNGLTEDRRGKKLIKGDTVEIDGQKYIIT